MAMRKAEKRALREGRGEFAEWMKVCRHFFPDLPEWLNGMVDPRNKSYISYPQAVLVLMCVMKNVSSLVTMKEMNDSFNETAAIKNLGILAGEEGLEEMPDWQTANNYFERLDPGEVGAIRRRMVVRLMRSKQFDRYKFKGCWKIVIDGTGIAYFKERHCEHDLVTKVKDKETGRTRLLYFHKVLEAKVILSPKVVISIDTEFIENESEDVTKQDCELNAAKRLLGRIKEQYPRLPVCVLADGLYATMPFMGLCIEHGFHYIINLKEGRQKTVYDDFRTLVGTEGYRHKKNGLCGIENGIGAFRNKMDEISGKEQPCNVFEYRYKNYSDGEIKETHFVWVTDMAITGATLESFILAGRQRWKIENEGFNSQKNGIYKIEHLCSRDPNAMKIHYLITQIADISMQLFLAFNKVINAIKAPIKDVARRIGEFFWKSPLDEAVMKYINKKTAMWIVADKT